jgi:hypothetical protein
MYPAAPRGHYPDPQEGQMYTTFNAARTRAHLSRHERQRLARTLAFSRRTPPVPPPAPMVELQRAELELIERLVHRDRTAVSSALLAVAGIGAGGARRHAVLTGVGEVARSAQAQGTISRERGAQITRHVNAALEASETRLAVAA